MQNFGQKIVKWFDKAGRKNLPWQNNITPYRVWVSEIMLQQTQVSTVIPYFHQFMTRFPTITALAAASEEAVLQIWTGLGYYARARNLHKTARIISTQYNGIFPTRFDEVLQLPGIGRSTAGAILAISMHQRYPILDGNVKRVLCRYFSISGWPGLPKVLEILWALSEKVTPTKRVADYTQAIMDLGATVCTRTKPNCHLCPLANSCQAKQLEQVKNFPTARPKQDKPIKALTLLMIMHPKQKTILLEKRPSKGIWGGLWSLPECPVKTKIPNWCQKKLNLNITAPEIWAPFRHTFTHYHLDIHPAVCRLDSRYKKIKNTPTKVWHTLDEPLTQGVAAPVKKLIESLALL